jgi:hypothetical protein
MPNRMDPSALREDVRSQEMFRLLAAYQDVLAFQAHLAGLFRQSGAKHVTMLDTLICLAVFTHTDKGGTRQQALVDMLEAPRSSIRDGLKRLEAGDLIFRAGTGRYFSTAKCATFANERADDLLRRIARLCAAYDDYASCYGANGRNPPP